MPSGGARARSGPPPDPNALRRDRDAPGDWSVLPPEGRLGPPPPWPLPAQTKREGTIWLELWTKPQAVKWEEFGLEMEVALYVRRLIGAEKRDASASDVTVVIRLAESLGVSTTGLARNRWRIGKPVTTGAVATVEPIEPSRNRLRVVAADASVEGP